MCYRKIKPVLEDGISARTIEFTEEEQKIVKGLFLLTTKPVLYVANVSEDEVADPDNIDYVKANSRIRSYRKCRSCSHFSAC